MAEVTEKPTVDYGVLVIGKPPGVDRPVVVTAHPGLPSRSSGKDTFGDYEGQTLTREQVVAIAGTSEVNVNTKLVPKPPPPPPSYYDDDDEDSWLVRAASQ